MQRIVDFIQSRPTTVGVFLFCAATAILIASIITSYLGLATLALRLGQIAQPICTSAVAVLVYLLFREYQSESALDA